MVPSIQIRRDAACGDERPGARSRSGAELRPPDSQDTAGQFERLADRRLFERAIGLCQRIGRLADGRRRGTCGCSGRREGTGKQREHRDQRHRQGGARCLVHGGLLMESGSPGSLACRESRLGALRRRDDLDRERIARGIHSDPDDRALARLAADQGAGDAALELLLQEALERAGAVDRVVAGAGDELARFRSELETDLALGESIAELGRSTGRRCARSPAG